MVDGSDCGGSGLQEEQHCRDASGKADGVPFAGGDVRLVKGSGSRRGVRRFVRYLGDGIARTQPLKRYGLIKMEDLTVTLGFLSLRVG